MKYIGKRTCYCAIEDDDYWGSGTMIKEAIKRHGKHNFRKTIFSVHDTEEEAWEMEKRLIRALDAINSKEYYNIAPGGPSRKKGFVMSEEEINKVNYLHDKMNNEVLYGVKIDKNGAKMRIMLGAYVIPKQELNYYVVDDDSAEVAAGKKKDDMVLRHYAKQMVFGDATKWMQSYEGAKYMVIPKEEFYDYHDKLLIYGHSTVVKEVLPKYTKYITDLQQVKINKASNKSLSSDGNKNNLATKKRLTKTDIAVNRIKELAKTSPQCSTFLDVYNQYKSLGLTTVYHAFTGRGSMNTNSFDNNKFNITHSSYNKAKKILEFESKFKEIAEYAGGKKDCLYIALAFCFENNKVDNDELLDKLEKQRKNKMKKKLTQIQSIQNAINQIDAIYNYRKKDEDKVSISLDYMNKKSTKK